MTVKDQSTSEEIQEKEISHMTCNTCGGRDMLCLYSNFDKPSVRIKKCPRDVLICRGCGQVCLDHSMITQKDLDEYYSVNNTFNKPGEIYEGQRKFREAQVAWVMSHLPDSHQIKTILDVGCGNGYILSLFKEEGFEVYGNDLSPIMVENLKKLYDIEGYAGSFESQLFGRKFDFITCATVLEHLLDPDSVIQSMYASLNRNGYVFIEVPDMETPYWKTISDHIAFGHLFHWTKRTLGRLLEKNGFKVEVMESIENKSGHGNPANSLRLLAKKAEGQENKKYINTNDFEHELQVIRDFKQKHERYLQDFETKLLAIKEKVGNQKIAIFCAGEHTSCLLGRFDFSAFNLECIFDSDPVVSGRSLNRLRVLHSSEVSKSDINHFIMSTTNHEREIYKFLKSKNPGCFVYGLYENFD